MREDAAGQAATTQKEMRDVEIKLGELDRLVITAPRDGTIFRMPIFERGQMVKEGDDLFTIVPDSAERAVELWVSGNDTPLVRPGDHVRLQFEGWPAVQFAGWPSVAVGTFGGQVISIDATDDGTGKFRLLVKQEGRRPVAVRAISAARRPSQRLGDAQPGHAGLRDLASIERLPAGRRQGRGCGGRQEGREETQAAQVALENMPRMATAYILRIFSSSPFRTRFRAQTYEFGCAGQPCATG